MGNSHICIMEEFRDSILINHFIISCEYSSLAESLMVYMEWQDGSNFQFLGSLNSIEEWDELKNSIELLCIKRGMINFNYHEFMLNGGKMG